MPRPDPPSDDFLRTVVDLHRQTGNKSEVARRLELDERTVRRHLTRAALRGLDDRNPPEGFEIRKITEGPGGRTVTSGPAAGEPFTVPPGRRIGKITHTVHADGRLGTQWFRTTPEDDRTATWVEAMKEAFAAAPAAPPVERPQVRLDDLFSLYPLADLHLGQRSWLPEAGENYDLDIACALVDQKMGQLVEMAPASGTAVLAVLGDCTNANDHSGKTPTSGHQQDEDGRWGKVITRAAELLDVQVSRLLAKHDKVIVVPLKGNHDSDAYLAYAIGLRMRYRDNARVDVKLVHSPCYYFEWGRVLIGLTHGHGIKQERMLEVMTGDVGAAFGRTDWHFFYSGHTHQERVRMIGKLKCRSFAPVTARSAWAAENGFHGTREFNVLTFHKETGPYSELPIFLPPPPQQEVCTG